jgi:hypothetical protein
MGTAQYPAPPSINHPAEVGMKAVRTRKELKQGLAAGPVASALRACFVHLCVHIHERQQNCVEDKIELVMESILKTKKALMVPINETEVGNGYF